MTWEPDYLTVEDAAAYLRIADDLDDGQLQTWVTAASRAIDARCNRQFGRLATAAAFTYDERPAYDPGTGLWFLAVDDVQDVTGLLVGGVAYAGQGAQLWPRNAAAKGRPYTHLVWASAPAAGPVTVTALFGWSQVPAQVVAACKLQVARFHARRDSPYGIAGSTTEGTALRLLARLDPDVAVSLAGLSRPRRAA